MKTMLLAVSGMSPAIITETLYGINKRGDAWPTSVKIITTSVGDEKIWNGLVKEGQLEKLCHELGKPLLSISRNDILVIPNADGKPVEDARSEDDHEALANFIISTVRDYTQDPNMAIHASLAGGRKTMTFYLGYAMTLFGRHFDRLSHVLISDGYENSRDFYFPTRDSQNITNSKGQQLDAKNAEVTLADIPFIRQRQLVPDMLTGLDEGNTKETVNFRQLVNLINLGEQAEQIRLAINAEKQMLTITSPVYDNINVDIRISNIWSWMLYLLIVEDSLQDDPDQRGNYSRPPTKGAADIFLAGMIAERLAEHTGITLSAETIPARLAELIDNQELWKKYPTLERTLKSIIEKDGIKGGQFDTYLQNMQKELYRKLPKNLAAVLMPTQLYDEDGEVLELSGKSKNKGAAYGIALPHPRKQITIF